MRKKTEQCCNNAAAGFVAVSVLLPSAEAAAVALEGMLLRSTVHPLLLHCKVVPLAPHLSALFLATLARWLQKLSMWLLLKAPTTALRRRAQLLCKETPKLFAPCVVPACE